MTDSLEALVDRAAEHVIDRPEMDEEDWEKAVALMGLFEAGYEDAAGAFVDRAIETQTGRGHLSYGSPSPVLDADLPAGRAIPSLPASLAYPALEAYDRTGDDRYLDAVGRQYAGLLEDSPRTEGGTLAFHTDLANRGIELWIDTVYLMCPWLVRYGRRVDDPEPVEEAIAHIEAHERHLLDDDVGLYRHVWRETPNTYPESTFWSRGNGWALTGFLDTLAFLPDDHPDRPYVRDLFERNAAAVLDRQDDSGLWYNILDDPYDRLESSGTAMFAYAFERGVDMGLLDADPYGEAAERAMDACAGLVMDDGGLDRVVVPPGGPDVPFGVTSYGQGWFLLAAAGFV